MARRVLSLALWAWICLHALCAIAAEDEPKLVSSVSIEGLVYCDQCFQDRVTTSSNLVEGAKVAVVCEPKSSEGAADRVEVVATTDARGQFKAELTEGAFDEDGEISCVAELRESPRRFCNKLGISQRSSPAFSRQTVGDAAVIYSAGALSFRPKSAGLFCAQASYYKAPMYTPPVYKPPMQKPPVYKPPMMKPPVYKPPMQKPPVYKPPMMKPPVYKPPMQKPPVYKPPMQKPPVYKPPMMKPPVYKPPVQKPPVYKPPMMKPPVYKPPVYTPPTYYKPPYSVPKFHFPKFNLPKFKFPKLPPCPPKPYP